MFEYTPKPSFLSGKVIFVTGASRGIGRAVAKAFAQFGATVLLHGRDESALEALYDEIVGEGYAEPYLFPLDLEVLDYETALSLKEHIEETFGHLDGLLHNAGVLGRVSPIENTLTTDFAKALQVNVNAAFVLTKAFLPLLKAAPNASLVFTSSSVGRKGRAYWGGYAVSKFAIEGLMQVLADELENVSNVRVNSVNPGATRTDMRRLAYPGESPMDNPSPEEILGVYLYLMSDDSLEINGEALNAQ